MFTGIIEQKAEILSNIKHSEGMRLGIASPFDDIQPGESIAVNGVCLTVLPESKAGLWFDVSPETLKLTTLSTCAPGDKVNLERALNDVSRLGGHLVSGHVDRTVAIQAIETEGEFLKVTFGPFERAEKQYLIPKGSITLDGVSLTINMVKDNHIDVQLVPHTLSVTTFGQHQVRQTVNVEFDGMAKMVAQQVRHILNETLAETQP